MSGTLASRALTVKRISMDRWNNCQNANRHERCFRPIVPKPRRSGLTLAAPLPLPGRVDDCDEPVTSLANSPTPGGRVTDHPGRMRPSMRASRSSVASFGGAPCGITFDCTHPGTTSRSQIVMPYCSRSAVTASACASGSGHADGDAASRMMSMRSARTPRLSTNKRPVQATSAYTTGSGSCALSSWYPASESSVPSTATYSPHRQPGAGAGWSWS